MKDSELILVMKKKNTSLRAVLKFLGEILETRDPISINKSTSHHVSSYSFFMITFGSLICVLKLSIYSAYHKRFTGTNPPSQDVIMPWKESLGFISIFKTVLYCLSGS
jgi:hypothetical protein